MWALLWSWMLLLPCSFCAVQAQSAQRFDLSSGATVKSQLGPSGAEHGGDIRRLNTPAPPHAGPGNHQYGPGYGTDSSQGTNDLGSGHFDVSPNPVANGVNTSNDARESFAPGGAASEGYGAADTGTTTAVRQPVAAANGSWSQTIPSVGLLLAISNAAACMVLSQAL